MRPASGLGRNYKQPACISFQLNVAQLLSSRPKGDRHHLQSISLHALCVVAIFARDDEHSMSEPQSGVFNVGSAMEMVGYFGPTLVEGLRDDFESIWSVRRTFDETAGSHEPPPVAASYLTSEDLGGELSASIPRGQGFLGPY
jgi:hypothetical protein